MSLNPVGLIAKAFYALYKAAILSAWNAARADAFAEIKASLPNDTDLNEIRLALPAPQTESEAEAEEKATKRKGRGA